MFSMVLNFSSSFFCYATVMCCSLAVEHVLKCSFYSSMYTPHTILAIDEHLNDEILEANVCPHTTPLQPQ